MELQEKFETIVKQSYFPEFKESKDMAKECTIICLEEQMKLVKGLLHKGNKEIWHEILSIELQLNTIKNETTNK